MRIAYFDCFSGASGDMMVGALLDAGLELERLEAELGKLELVGYSLSAESVERGPIAGTRFVVETDEESPARTVAELLQILDSSKLDNDVRASSKAVIRELAEAESKIHGRPVDELHLHETSGIDSIVDIVASVAGLKILGIDAVFASRVHTGTGFVECAHGTLPVPAPATLALLSGIPVYSHGIESELVTPTGAALLRVLTQGFGAIPPMTVDAIGYGAGTRELAIPNMLRIVVGEAIEPDHDTDEVVLVEANIDDMNPEFFGHASDLLWDQGALDVYLTPVFMKKGRPGTILSVVAPEDRVDGIVSIIFRETSTLGVRTTRVRRRKLSRRTLSVKTDFGRVGVKLGRLGDRVVRIAPEYEDCREAALKSGVPIADVYHAARSAALEALGSNEGIDHEGRLRAATEEDAV